MFPYLNFLLLPARFNIDCDDLEVGDTIQFWLWCCDKFYPIVASNICRAGRARAQRSAHRFVDTSCAPLIKKYKDDNDGLVYKVNMICSNKHSEFCLPIDR